MFKALTWLLEGVLPVSPRCYHVRGHGGAKAAVREIQRQLAGNVFVFRTDVESYYDSIDHDLLFDRLARHVADAGILDLLRQFLRRTTERGGVFWEHRQGISRGCPLSPLIGGFFLYQPTRWRLRRAVKTVNEVLAGLGLAKHPEKTFVGRIAKGFDFLGYAFGLEGLRVSEPALARFHERCSRLQEQEPGRARLREYVRRWSGWVRGGLGEDAVRGLFVVGPGGLLSAGRFRLAVAFD